MDITAYGGKCNGPMQMLCVVFECRWWIDRIDKNFEGEMDIIGEEYLELFVFIWVR